MFGVNIRLQVAALCFLIIIIYNYSKMEKLPLLSTRIFNGMLLFTSISLIFDMCTVYTITHMDWVSPQLNRLFHQLFIGSLDTNIYLFYMYVLTLGNNQKRKSKFVLLLHSTPAILAILVVIFAPLYYYVGSDGAYSYGPMANTVYGFVFFYLFLLTIDSFKYRNILNKERVISIRCAASIWLIASIIQVMKRTLLVSGLASVLMILFLYLSFENPKEFTDEETKTFNKRGFATTIKEYIERKKQYYVLDIIIKDSSAIYALLGQDAAGKLLSSVMGEIKFKTKKHIFRTKTNVFTILFDNKEQVTSGIDIVKEVLSKEYVVNQINVNLKTIYYVLKCPDLRSTEDEIVDFNNYISKNYDFGLDGEVVIVDKKLIESQERENSIFNILSNAIENDGFEMYYQPILDVKHGGFASAEALVRLKDTSTLGFISPEEFIPIAEKKGLIMDIGEIIFRKICYFMVNENIKSLGVKYIEVNLSGVQASDTKIAKQLKSIMNEFHIEPYTINLEITETAAVEYKDILKTNMQALRELGCSFSMDDFGTGYSNLSQIDEVSYDLIKIDKSLIWPCFGDNDTEKSKVLLENVIQLITKMGIKIVAEGVETNEQADYLKNIGVDYFQGYLYSRPITADKYKEFLIENGIRA